MRIICGYLEGFRARIKHLNATLQKKNSVCAIDIQEYVELQNDRRSRKDTFELNLGVEEIC